MRKMILFMHHPSMMVHLWVLVHFGQMKGQKDAHELYVFATHYLPKCTSVCEDYILAFFLLQIPGLLIGENENIPSMEQLSAFTPNFTPRIHKAF
jgi:hypothetical protein